ncbi:hypothetical protein G6F68_015466 [Rhizopus microsporus]|nr:hypothetical protein G6F68_015466 [Rhizopus microsporus]
MLCSLQEGYALAWLRLSTISIITILIHLSQVLSRLSHDADASKAPLQRASCFTCGDPKLDPDHQRKCASRLICRTHRDQDDSCLVHSVVQIHLSMPAWPARPYLAVPLDSGGWSDPEGHRGHCLCLDRIKSLFGQLDPGSARDQ